MPKILVNYKHNAKTDKYTLLQNDVVFADLPIAVMEMAAEYDDILVVPINKVNTVVDKEEYLKVNKLFKLSVDPDGTIKEDPNGVAVYLPKDTNVSKLKIVNGQLALIEEDENTENIKEGE